MLSAYLFLSTCNCVGALCTLMFQLQVSASNLSIQIYQAFGIGSLMILFLFLFCYFGEMVTDRSSKVSKAACMSLWYCYPLKLQRYLILTIGYSNMEFHFSGLSLMYCTMASFSGVSCNLFSFYKQKSNFISFRSWSKHQCHSLCYFEMLHEPGGEIDLSKFKTTFSAIVNRWRTLCSCHGYNTN